MSPRGLLMLSLSGVVLGLGPVAIDAVTASVCADPRAAGLVTLAAVLALAAQPALVFLLPHHTATKVLALVLLVAFTLLGLDVYRALLTDLQRFCGPIMQKGLGATMGGLILLALIANAALVIWLGARTLWQMRRT